ncbi:uncharacterized protein LOC115726021 isoform X1 [Rhodamnia argentea]|uniref:Uncharacterized protein LOC115726021 isoform X1 n=1 Tax=Rhodamnia argentea TaxID=178133 RepID=A0A8B8MLV4_9MYRT|nr:uncharacterized protein LOC115726021 isoform X1 [Rhodamnia argentea]
MDCSPIGSTGTIDLTEPEPEPEVDLSGGAHLLPCTIKYDGPCSVSQYFKPRPTGMEADGLAVQEAYFRGRKLQGAAVPLPPGYSGCCSYLLSMFVLLILTFYFYVWCSPYLHGFCNPFAFVPYIWGAHYFVFPCGELCESGLFSDSDLSRKINVDIFTGCKRLVTCFIRS